MTAFADLVGKTIVRVDGLEVGSDVVHIETADRRRYRMHHSQDCCESVAVEDVSGDVSDIIGSPVLFAEESSNSDNPPELADSHLWTFYRILTGKGLVVIRWLGESNGYYSESVDFEEVDPAPAPPEVKLMPIYKPYGKLVLVKLDRADTGLEIVGDAKYKTTGEVIGVGPEVVGLHEGDHILINGSQPMIASEVLGEGIVLVPAPLVLATRVDG